MAEFPVRKIAVITEEIFHEGGPPPEEPRLRAAAMAVVKNPFAGRYVERLQSAMEDLKPLGLLLSDRLIDALGGDPKKIDGYGKGAICGTAGELEHCALWHVPGGTPCVTGSAAPRRSCRRPARSAPSARASTFRSAISTPPMCAAISTRWRWG